MLDINQLTLARDNYGYKANNVSHNWIWLNTLTQKHCEENKCIGVQRLKVNRSTEKHHVSCANISLSLCHSYTVTVMYLL